MNQAGSISNHGAESNLLPSFVERLTTLPDFPNMGYSQLMANSFLISADMGHAVCPILMLYFNPLTVTRSTQIT